MSRLTPDPRIKRWKGFIEACSKEVVQQAQEEATTRGLIPWVNGEQCTRILWGPPPVEQGDIVKDDVDGDYTIIKSISVYVDNHDRFVEVLVLTHFYDGQLPRLEFINLTVPVTGLIKRAKL